MEARQVENKSELAYRCFVDTCRSPATRQVYTMALSFFMSYLKLPSNAYDKLLDKDPKLIQMDICDFITYLRKRGNSSATVATYTAALNKFFVINDVTSLNWKKIKSFMGEHEKTTEDRPYTHSEIQTLLQHSSLRNRAMIYLMSSAGLRCGALPLLRIRDLVPVEIDGFKLFKIFVYAKSKKSCYFTWCTPEARHHTQLYLDNRKRWGERLTEDSPLFRADYNQRAATRGGIKPISIGRIRHIVGDTLRSCGLRTISLEKEGKPFQRQRANIMANHGMRKFFESNAYKAGMDLMYIRRLMGQKSGELEEAYLQISEQELLEGDSKHVGYIGIIDQLEIESTGKMKREIQTLRVEKSHWESMRKDLDELKEMMFNPKLRPKG